MPSAGSPGPHEQLRPDPGTLDDGGQRDGPLLGAERVAERFVDGAHQSSGSTKTVDRAAARESDRERLVVGVAEGDDAALALTGQDRRAPR